MPRAKSNTRVNQWERPGDRSQKQAYGMNADFSGWVNHSLPASSKTAYSEWLSSQESIKDVQTVVDDHYRLSVAEDLRDGGYVATAFMRSESSPNAGKMTSQRSGDPMNALYKLVWAITHEMPDDWHELETGGGDDW